MQFLDKVSWVERGVSCQEYVDECGAGEAAARRAVQAGGRTSFRPISDSEGEVELRNSRINVGGTYVFVSHGCGWCVVNSQIDGTYRRANVMAVMRWVGKG